MFASMTKKRYTYIRLAADDIQNMVHMVRGQRVMLDSDLARLYGVTTMRLNEQVARNRERFPEDFAYQLTQQEVTILISQNAISRSAWGGRRKLPWAITGRKRPG
jgi:hypothetical protein